MMMPLCPVLVTLFLHALGKSMDSSSLSNLGFLFVLAFVERDCLVRERFSVDDDLDRRDLLVSEILVRVSL